MRVVYFCAISLVIGASMAYYALTLMVMSVRTTTTTHFPTIVVMPSDPSPPPIRKKFSPPVSTPVDIPRTVMLADYERRSRELTRAPRPPITRSPPPWKYSFVAEKYIRDKLLATGYTSVVIHYKSREQTTVSGVPIAMICTASSCARHRRGA